MPAFTIHPLLSCLRLGVLFGAGWLAGGAGAQALDYADALERSRQVSGNVQGARLDAQAKGLQAEAVQGLGGPMLGLNAFAGRVSTQFNLDVSRVANAVNPIIGGIDSAVPSLDLPQLPNTLSTTRIFDLQSAGLSALWPLYTGGRLGAVQGLAEGRAREARSDQQDAEDKLATLTAQRYFTLQLARAAVKVREAAVTGIAEHQRSAERLESGGFIATADRLKADVALAGAQRDLAKARSDLQLAGVALARHLALDDEPPLTTPLFVHRESVGTLRSFVDAGRAHHPAWEKIAGKRDQADQALKLGGHEYAPTVVALANYNLNHSNEPLVKPNWFVGLMVTVPLVSPVDRGKLQHAARLERERVDVSASQAERDVPTLIESQWRSMENARAAFLAMDASIRLAEENLRLQETAFRNAQNTTVDVTDARLNLAKVQTERLQAAHDYVLSLARLLEACGQPERLPELARTADITLPLD